MDMTVLESRIGEWQRRNFPGTPLHRPLLGAMEELGELCHAVLKREQGIRGTAEQHTDAVRDALGDIVIFLIHVAAIEGTTLADCIERAWREVQHRDWVRNPANGAAVDAVAAAANTTIAEAT